MSTEVTTAPRHNSLVLYEDERHGLLVLTDRMAAIQAAMDYDVFDYILEAFYGDKWDAESVAIMLSEDSGIPVSAATVKRWIEHGAENDGRLGSFNREFWRYPSLGGQRLSLHDIDPEVNPPTPANRPRPRPTVISQGEATRTMRALRYAKAVADGRVTPPLSKGASE